MFPAQEIAAYVCIGVLWGSTNALIKQSRLVQGAGPHRLSDFGFTVPQSINFAASTAFALLLGHSRLSIAVPVANSVSVCSTLLLGWALGEPIKLPLALLGACLVVTGVTVCASA